MTPGQRGLSTFIPSSPSQKNPAKGTKKILQPVVEKSLWPTISPLRLLALAEGDGNGLLLGPVVGRRIIIGKMLAFKCA